jgi:hypothetical protein
MHYVKANGKSVLPNRGIAIEGWKFVPSKEPRRKGKWHLFFADGSTGCIATAKLKPYHKEAREPAYEKDCCAFCVDVDARYKRDAGVDLYNALQVLLKEGTQSVTAREGAKIALAKALNHA